MWGDSPVAPRSLARTLLQKSHVISLGQFLICPENVGIATTRFQSLKDGSGNYVRHFWGTMRVSVGGGRCAGALGCGCVVYRGWPRVGRGQPFLPENSHVIYLGQFLICPENVGIATTQFQSLKDGSGNYVRHLWGTMRVSVGGGRCAGASGCGCVVCRGRPRVGRGQPFLPENSHVIYLGQFLMCRENVGIATTRFQSLKDGSGNYVRHFWGTMWVCGGLAGGQAPRRRENGSRRLTEQAPRP